MVARGIGAGSQRALPQCHFGRHCPGRRGLRDRPDIVRPGFGRARRRGDRTAAGRHHPGAVGGGRARLCDLALGRAVVCRCAGLDPAGPGAGRSELSAPQCGSPPRFRRGRLKI